MHAAPERDNFVKINFDNIIEESKRNFKKYAKHVHLFDTQYDFHSLMHYGKYAFAIDWNVPTIIPHERDNGLGQRMGEVK